MGTIKNCDNPKMKITQAVIFAVAAADEKKVPPRHPLQRLNRLVEFSTELLTDHFDWWKRQEKFISKFSKAADRMKNAFERNEQKCGYYDPDNLPHGGPAPADDDRKRRDLSDMFDSYNREDPYEGAKQVTTGYRKWAERYIAGCNGQKNHQHQVKRFNHYYGVLVQALYDHGHP